MAQLAAGGALLAALAVGITLWVSLGHAARAQAQVDISGAWGIEVEGFAGASIPCSAFVDQLDAAFSMDIECPSLGFGAFEGALNTETGEFTATGDFVGITVELAGSASLDGESMEGTWSSGMLGASGTFLGTRSDVLPTPTPLPTLPSPVDLSGSWRISFGGVFSGTCESVIEQTGGELVSVADCPYIGTQRFSGTIDEATGAFAMSASGGIQLEGVAAADGNSLFGSWSLSGLFSGSLSGERADDLDLIDTSGEWDVVLLGHVSDTCTLQIEQGLAEAEGTISCENLGASTLSGTVNPFSGFLSLEGPIGDVNGAIGAAYGQDGAYLFGWQFDASGEQVSNFIAVPAGALTGGIILVDCRPESDLLSVNCAHMEGTEFDVHIHVAVAPADGHGGIQAAVQWPPFLLFRPSEQPADDVVSGSCTLEERAVSEATALFTCPLTSQTPGSFTGGLINLAMTCQSTGEGQIDLNGGEGTHFLDAGDGGVAPTLINAAIECYGPQRGGPPLPIGDADCGYDVNSVDAALVLQFEAGLIASLRCQHLADVNGDDSVNSLDAALILQHTAGLISQFPAPAS